jgi:hypothetical protein
MQAHMEACIMPMQAAMYDQTGMGNEDFTPEHFMKFGKPFGGLKEAAQPPMVASTAKQFQLQVSCACPIRRVHVTAPNKPD